MNQKTLKAKRTDSGEWIGFDNRALSMVAKGTFVLSGYKKIQIDPKTICATTGARNSIQQSLYIHDIMGVQTDVNPIGFVDYNHATSRCEIRYFDGEWLSNNQEAFAKDIMKHGLVLGNIHDVFMLRAQSMYNKMIVYPKISVNNPNNPRFFFGQNEVDVNTLQIKYENEWLGANLQTLSGGEMELKVKGKLLIMSYGGYFHLRHPTWEGLRKKLSGEYFDVEYHGNYDAC